MKKCLKLLISDHLFQFIVYLLLPICLLFNDFKSSKTKNCFEFSIECLLNQNVKFICNVNHTY